MRPDESLYPPDWRRHAEKDWKRVEQNLSNGDVEDAGVHLQQAVEKFLKAYLLSKGWTLHRTHDLELLLNNIIEMEPEFEKFTDACQTISGFYFLNRYPMKDEPS